MDTCRDLCADFSSSSSVWWTMNAEELYSENVDLLAVIIKATIHLQKGESANALGVLLTELNRHGFIDHIKQNEYQTEG